MCYVQARYNVVSKIYHSFMTKLFIKLKFSAKKFEAEICQRILRLEEYLRKTFKISEEEGLIVEPPIKNCEKCKAALKEKQKNGVFLLNIIINCIIVTKICKNSECPSYNNLISYQGDIQGLVNWNNKVLIGVEIVRQYLDLYAANGTPFVSFIKDRLKNPECLQTNEIYKEKMNLKPYFGYLQAAFAISAEKFEHQSSPCCQNPRFITMDGFVLSIKSDRMGKFKAPWNLGVCQQRATKRSERQLPSLSKEEEKLLRDLRDKGSCSKRVLDKMKTSQHLGLQVIAPMLVEKGTNFELPKECLSFISFLIKKVSAVVSLVPASCYNIANR